MDYKGINDYEILSMIRENSDDAQGILYRKYYPIIKKLASYYYFQNKFFGADYDDFVQECLIGFSRAIRSYNENKNALFYTYVCSVMNKRLKSYVSGLRSKKNSFLNFGISDDIVSYTICDKRINLFNKICTEDEFVKLKNYFSAKVSPVFELRYNGFTYREIAILLDVSMSTVDARIFKIKESLRRQEII